MKIINLDGRRNVSGERVRQMRTKKRMTQADLAAKVQTTGVILEQDAISRIESGSRMVQDYELRALAEVLGVTSDWLMDEEKVKQKMPCFFNKLFCVILCILGSTKRPPAKVPPIAYALSCYFRVIFVCYACVFLLNMNEREQHALRRHPLGQRRVRTAPA